jgi:putative acetyltransferase
LWVEAQHSIELSIIEVAMKIATLNPAAPAARALIGQLDALQQALYPPESNHLDGVEALQAPNALFLGAWLGDEVVGCGAVKTLEDDGRYGEIKRLIVAAPFRGRGVSKAIMAALEAHLVERGIASARLETGTRQPEAIGLYRRLGYRERGPFGRYRSDPLSVFMEKNFSSRA